MANLPPRPKSPLPSMNVRDRVASAQPMASRPRDDRHPPNRSRDTYIPLYREGRRDDRDRDRYRDYDRRDRYRRDWSPPPRRRDSPDRDRRPPHRGPPRRYASPRRGSYYQSRSRSPRRGSPSPRRYRSRTRSRSRSPRRSPRALRMAHRSPTNSPRSHSPLKRRPSRSRSPKPHPERPSVQETDSKADVLNASIPPLTAERPPPPQLQPPERPINKEEEPNISFPAYSPEISLDNITTTHLEHPSTDPATAKVESLKSEEVCIPLPLTVEDEVKSEPASQTDIRAPVDGTIMNFDSPIPPTRAPRSPPRTSSVDELSNRPSGLGVPRPRSPPRGPRAYSGHSRSSNIHPHPSAPGNTQSYPPGSRAPKQRQKTGVFVQNHRKKIYVADGESIELPAKMNPIIDEMEKAVTATRRTATKLTLEILHQSKQLSRQLHEFQLASMDLRAAESRRKMSEIHLEKARNGTLGIGYSEEPVEPKC